MSENILSAVLTFSLLAAGTAAVGSEMMAPRHAVTEVATLPTVTVIGKRVAAADAVTLPMVMVTGCRHADTEVAVDDSAIEQRVQ
jgi:hypothetical protein